MKLVANITYSMSLRLALVFIFSNFHLLIIKFCIYLKFPSLDIVTYQASNEIETYIKLLKEDFRSLKPRLEEFFKSFREDRFSSNFLSKNFPLLKENLKSVKRMF